MREYEMILVMKPDCSDELLDRVFGKVTRVFDENGGHLLTRDAWGKKKLAYDVQKNSKGLFFQLNYLGEGKLNDELIRICRLDDNVLRYMPVKVADDVDVEARMLEAKTAVASTAPASVSFEDQD